MAKASASVQFRTVDVDLYNEDAYQDFCQGDGEETNGITGPNEEEIRSLLTQNKKIEALKTVLRCPPLNTKDQAVKDRVFQLVMDVLSSFNKSGEIDQGVNALDATARDTLMKYIYRGFEKPSESSSSSLLNWHEKTFAISGLGSIVRVLTDRKRV